MTIGTYNDQAMACIYRQVVLYMSLPWPMTNDVIGVHFLINLAYPLKY